MNITDIKLNIERLKKDYTDPSDREVLKEWETRLATMLSRQRYSELNQTKELVAYLNKRLRDIKIKLSSDDSLELLDIKSFHRVAKEIKDILALLVIDPQKDMQSLESEISNIADN